MEENDFEKQDFSGGMNGVNPPLSIAGGLAYSAGVIAFVVMSLVFVIISLIAGLGEGTDGYTYLNYLAAPVAIAATCVFIIKNKKLSAKKLFPVKCHPKYYVIAVLLVFGLLFFAGLVDTPVLEFFKLLGYEERGAESYFPDVSGGRVVLALLVMAVLPAVFEEALFRGVILNTIEDSMGTVRTVFVVGFCFALFHASPEQTVYQFVAGCAFAFIAIRSGSILPSVLMHFLNNGIIVVFKACGMFDEAGSLIMPEAAFIAVTVLAAISFFGAVAWLILDKKPVKKCQKGGVRAFFIYASAGILILAIMWILSFFL